MYIERDITSLVESTVETFPIVLLTGPRQIGKSTLLQTLSKRSGTERTYVSLDDLDIRELAKSDPKLFMQRYAPPVIIDEIQYAPELFPYLKLFVDEHTLLGQIWLTGSQAFAMMDGVQESLAGRVGILDLTCLTQREIFQQRSAGAVDFTLEYLRSVALQAEIVGERAIFDRIVRGGMPAVIANPRMNVAQYYASYISTYIERDIRKDVALRDEFKFMQFLRAAASRIGQLLNITNLAQDCEVSPPTAKTWLGLLEKAGLIYYLHPYSGNMLKRMVKAPKLYFADTGLASYLTGWDSGATAALGAMAGQLFENYVVSQIRASYINSGTSVQMYYLRTRDGAEIDLVLVRNGTVVPVEIKKSASPSMSSTRAFKLLDQGALPRSTGAIVCLAQELLPRSEEVIVVPVGLL